MAADHTMEPRPFSFSKFAKEWFMVKRRVNTFRFSLYKIISLSFGYLLQRENGRELVAGTWSFSTHFSDEVKFHPSGKRGVMLAMERLLACVTLSFQKCFKSWARYWRWFPTWESFHLFCWQGLHSASLLKWSLIPFSTRFQNYTLAKRWKKMVSLSDSQLLLPNMATMVSNRAHGGANASPGYCFYFLSFLSHFFRFFPSFIAFLLDLSFVYFQSFVILTFYFWLLFLLLTNFSKVALVGAETVVFTLLSTGIVGVVTVVVVSVVI